MSLNPFSADPATAARIESLGARIGQEIVGEICRIATRRHRETRHNLGGVVLREEVDELVARYGLTSDEDLMLLALNAARGQALPPISNFFVGAVGREAETGNLLLGGNIEFPGTHLGYTVHGETCLAMRAHSRGTALDRIALGEAHPCAHCRQFLSEFVWSRDLVLIDPHGHRLTLSQLYPWPFDPNYLGNEGAVPGRKTERVMLSPTELPESIATPLLAAGRRAHAPYSNAPGAIVLMLADGALVTGASVESVAFNPTMGPVSAAIIDLVAHGYRPTQIVGAVLGTRLGGAVDYVASSREILNRIAPLVDLKVIGWAQC